MKKTLLLSLPVLISAMLIAGCGMDKMVGADMSELAQGSLAKGDVPAPTPVIITTVPLVAAQKVDMGDVQVWNDNAKLYVKVIADTGWMLARSQLAVDTSFALIPHNKNGRPMPNKFANKRIYDPLTQSDTYEFPLAWAGGTQIYLSMHAQVKQLKKNGKIGEARSAWSAGSGYPGKKFDKYFTDIIDKSIIIIIK